MLKHYRPSRWKRWVAALTYGALFVVLGSFLWVQLGPSCYSHADHAQTEERCSCEGIEFTRTHSARAGSTASSICFGLAKHQVNFLYWLPDGLNHAGYMVIGRAQDSTILANTADPAAIQSAAAIFEKLREGWQVAKDKPPTPTHAVAFYENVPGPTEKKGEVWFGIGPTGLQLKSGYIRTLNSEEEAELKKLVGG